MNRRVLVVDDDPENLKLLGEILENEGCDYKLANSGVMALDILSQWPAALVILDQDMPGLTGLDVLRVIKRDCPDSDVMFISAHSNPRMVSQALESGADDYIRKPFSVIELVSRLRVRFRIRDLREQLRVANQMLADLSKTDDLTGLYNMRGIYDRIEYEIKRALRASRHISCIMLDMDNFKNVNDGHDHLFGSFVIKEMGRLIKESLREVDFAARYGGDEFLIVLTEADEHGVRTFCERLREKVRGHLFKEGRDQMKLTLSIGYAVSGLVHGYTARDLVRVADHALYESKENGRDRVTGYGPSETTERLFSTRKKAA